MSLRKISSLTALLSFLALLFTGVITYLAPRGPGSSDWEALGCGKHDWYALHTDLGILFLAAGFVHIILNIKPLVSYLKNKQKKLRVFTLNFNIALVLTVWVIAGSLLDLAPFSMTHEFKEGRNTRSRHHPAVTASPQEPLPEKPPFLYGSRSLDSLCTKYNLEAEPVVQHLESLGIAARAEWSINWIAETNAMESRSVYEAIRQIHMR